MLRAFVLSFAGWAFAWLTRKPVASDLQSECLKKKSRLLWGFFYCLLECLADFLRRVPGPSLTAESGTLFPRDFGRQRMTLLIQALQVPNCRLWYQIEDSLCQPIDGMTIQMQEL